MEKERVSKINVKLYFNGVQHVYADMDEVFLIFEDSKKINNSEQDFKGTKDKKKCGFQ